MIPQGPTSTHPPTFAARFGESTADYVAGVISGFGKVAAGHPFDTLKGRVQSGRFRTPAEALVRTVKDEGILTLYQGVSMPTVSVCFVGGLVFYFNAVIRRLLQPDPKGELTYFQMFLAGSGAGVVAGAAVNPIEVLKVHMQVQNRRAQAYGVVPGTKGRSNSLMVLIRSIGFRNAYTGVGPTLIREIGTFGIFFPANEFNKDLIIKYVSPTRAVAPKVRPTGPIEAQHDLGKPKKPKLNIAWRVGSAWLAGVVCWLPVYPIDVIKTRMQLRATDRRLHPDVASTADKPYKNMLHCAKDIYTKEGLAVFGRGLTPCLLRAGPAYAAQYTLYEYAVGILHR
jgi:solute carrier family 25 carnitine/acylcarnitine transporter 20/29